MANGKDQVSPARIVAVLAVIGIVIMLLPAVAVAGILPPENPAPPVLPPDPAPVVTPDPPAPSGTAAPGKVDLVGSVAPGASPEEILIHSGVVPPPTYDTPSDDAVFGHSAFVGNSTVERLFMQGFAKDAVFLSKTSLTVFGAFDTAPTRGDRPLVEMFNKGVAYKRIFIEFGVNELGYDKGDFIAAYEKMVKAILAYQPGAVIYIQSILPVSASRSAQNLYGVTNERILSFNAALKDMAARNGWKYLDIHSAMCDSSGALPAAASSDGVHMTPEYSGLWIDYIRNHVTE